MQLKTVSYNSYKITNIHQPKAYLRLSAGYYITKFYKNVLIEVVNCFLVSQGTHQKRQTLCSEYTTATVFSRTLISKIKCSILKLLK